MTIWGSMKPEIPSSAGISRQQPRLLCGPLAEVLPRVPESTRSVPSVRGHTSKNYLETRLSQQSTGRQDVHVQHERAASFQQVDPRLICRLPWQMADSQTLSPPSTFTRCSAGLKMATGLLRTADFSRARSCPGLRGSAR